MRKTTAEKIQSEQERKKQSDNRIKLLKQQQKVEDRKARTKRLIERGAIIESLIENAGEMTNEQFMAFIADKLGKQLPPLPVEEAADKPMTNREVAEVEIVTG